MKVQVYYTIDSIGEREMGGEKKNFLFVSYDALITDIAWKVSREGHNVRYYIKSESASGIGDGFVPKTGDWENDADWADVVIFDDVLGHGTFAWNLREQGKAVIGGTPYTDRLEDDRAFGQEELKKAGVTIIPQWSFDSFDDAVQFIRQKPQRYVLKPSGKAQNIKRLLFVGEEEDGRDVIRVLEAYKKAWAGTIREFQLQKRVSGVEVAVGAFFNGSEFIFPVNINFEHKKLFPGNIGPATGEMGTSMFWSMPNRLFNATLKKMEPRLRDEGYVGYMDINCIVNANGIYPLEFTSRFGYPTIFIQQEGIQMEMGDFLHGLAYGTLTKFRARKGFQIGVRIVVPPFPYSGDRETFDAYSRDAVVIFKKPTEGVHIEDVKLVRGQWLVTGSSGVVLLIVGMGQTMRQAQNQTYARIKNILIPNMYYRKDIGDRWIDDSDRLHNWGYLREL